MKACVLESPAPIERNPLAFSDAPAPEPAADEVLGFLKSTTLEDLISDTQDGIYFECDKSWSIDDLRLNFQFSCEAAWEIKHGKKTRLLRDPRYTGITPEFWRSCDAICGESDWQLFGIATCGKGDPMQIMQVGHGAAPARFRQVAVGNTGRS